MRGGGVDAVHNKAQPISAGNTEMEIRLEVDGCNDPFGQMWKCRML
jgi:hypothetical protein